MPIGRKYIPHSLINFARRCANFFRWDEWVQQSWSQEGEDMILRRLFENQKHGFYVDVGAHHPKRFSNTYLFYSRGWHGINIDAMPGSMRLFNKLRPRDINIEIGVSQSEGGIDYFIFNEPALNGFSPELSKIRDNEFSSPYKIVSTVRLDVKPLSAILDLYAFDKKIDFLTVDVEGLDFDVLMSNDWSKYRPKYVLAEVLGSSLGELSGNEIVEFMQKCRYEVFAKQVNTVFFRNTDPEN